MKKSRLLVAFLFGAVLAVGIIAIRESAGQERPSITVYKSPTCGCCSKWVDHLEENGFDVTSIDTDDVAMMKARYGVPGDLTSCHTALVGGYVVEGHVPAAEIHRLLEERPEIAGLAVPGMPMGSPGMEGARTDAYDVVSFQNNGGGRAVFASY